MFSQLNGNKIPLTMETKTKSPKIDSIEWGQVTTAEGNSYKDAKLFPGGSRTWDWNETGTHHQPGIQPADVQELIDNGANAIVLSQGFHKRLQVCDETEQLLNDKKIDFFILETEKATVKYNELCENSAAGALIHSTC